MGKGEARCRPIRRVAEVYGTSNRYTALESALRRRIDAAFGEHSEVKMAGSLSEPTIAIFAGIAPPILQLTYDETTDPEVWAESAIKEIVSNRHFAMLLPK